MAPGGGAQGVERIVPERYKSGLRAARRAAAAAESAIDSSGEHPARVGTLVRLLALEMGHIPRTAIEMGLAAEISDLGMLTVPAPLLTQADPLTDVQRETIQRHVLEGAKIVESIESLEMNPFLMPAVRHHHERWDGSGYPGQMVGESIPMVARFTALADTFDALTHTRPWREALSPDEALMRIEMVSGTQFGPAETEAFCEVVRQVLRAHGSDFDRFLAQEAQLLIS